MAAPQEIDLSAYNDVGHAAWKANRARILLPQTINHAYLESQRRKIEREAARKGLTRKDIQQARHEGGIAARIEDEEGFSDNFTISGLKAQSRTDFSPLACVARELKLIGMIQRGEVSGYIIKETGQDILPQLEEGLASIKVNP